MERKPYILLLGVYLCLIAACGRSPEAAAPDAAPTHAQPVPPPAPPPAPPAVTADGIRQSRIQAVLRTANGQSVRVYLHAPDEKARTDEGPSCMAMPGEAMYSGDYAFYVEPETGGRPERQAVSPFGQEAPYFNEDRIRQYVRVFPGGQGRPDLLVMRQYASCNGTTTAVLAPTADGRLVAYQFKRADGSVIRHLFAGVFEPDAEKPGYVKSMSYNNAERMTSWITWEVRDGEALLVAVEVKTEVR